MLTHRFVAIGDIHLTSGPRNADRLSALDTIIDANLSQQVSAWLLLGDLSHSGLTIQLRNMLIERALRMAAIAPVLVLKGNHDPDGDLDFLSKLKAPWPIHVSSAPEVVTIDLARGGTLSCEQAAIACLPYPSKAAIVAAGTPNDQIGLVAANAFDVICMDLSAQLDDARRRGLLTLAVGHMTIGGAVASTGQPQIGSELEISESHLARLGNCPVLFGHIHKHQQVGAAFYAGSLCRLDWAEVEPKGYLVVNVGQQDHVVSFVELPVPKAYHVDGALTRDAFTWQVTKGPDSPRDEPPSAQCAACDGSGDGARDLIEGTLQCVTCRGSGYVVDWTNCDLRVRARYPQHDRGILDGAYERVKAMFPGVRRFEFEPVAVLERALRAPEVIAAQTLDEKLRAMATLAGTEWTDGLSECATKLQARENADALVSDVESRLSDLARFDMEPVA